MNEIKNPQGVGLKYNKAEFKKSQTLGFLALDALKEKIKPGMTEKDGRAIYSEISAEFGIQKNWHPPKIRFGPNSIKSFREISDEDYRLKENDIFFIDLGPIINGYESDVGRTYMMAGNKSELHKKIIIDGEKIFNLTRNEFLKNNLNGPALYKFAEDQAVKHGWQLVDEGANGHRVGDFPHHVFYSGSLREFNQEIVPDLWILEIQLRSPDLTFGSFFEDIL